MNADAVCESWYGLQFDVRRSVRYHQRRRRFFDGLDTLSNTLSVVFGSVTVYGVLAVSSSSLALVAAGLVTVVSTVNLTVGSARKAWLHADLARRFVDLERQLLAEPSEQALRQAQAVRLAIEADEPPVLRVLDSLCHNEVLHAQGQDEYRVGPITVWQRLLANILDLRPHRIGHA